jgi:hypothetical protein
VVDQANDEAGGRQRSGVVRAGFERGASMG